MGSHNILIEAEWGPPHPGPYLFFPHQGGRAGSSICLWGNISLSGCLREGEHLQGREPLSSRAEVMVRENGGLGAFTWPWPCWGEEFSPTWLPKDELEGRRRVLLSVKARHNWPELGLLYKFLSLIKCSFKTFLKPTSPATKKSGRHEPLARGCSGAALQGHQHWAPKLLIGFWNNSCVAPGPAVMVCSPRYAHAQQREGLLLFFHPLRLNTDVLAPPHLPHYTPKPPGSSCFSAAVSKTSSTSPRTSE